MFDMLKVIIVPALQKGLLIGTMRWDINPYKKKDAQNISLEPMPKKKCT